jgi:hypothetical protein
MTPPPPDAILITTINSPGVPASAFGKVSGWRLMVVGDRKTPDGWEKTPYWFISAKDQERLSFSIMKDLPWNHYARKMVGYLMAMAEGAERIADSDDDNAPLPNWEFPVFDKTYSVSGEDRGFINVYRLFSEDRPCPWPRGFPLNRILEKPADEAEPPSRSVRVGIWQGLVAGEADVDAIYRLTVNRPARFIDRPPLVLDSGTLCPFNSQNTVFRKALFPLLYLPAFVTFRFTDILRSLVAQPILWAAGYRLGFISPTVFQERNAHNLMADFQSEIPCYLHSEKAAEIVWDRVRSERTVSENLLVAYDALAGKGLVPPQEVTLASAWVDDLKRLGAA